MTDRRHVQSGVSLVSRLILLCAPDRACCACTVRSKVLEMDTDASKWCKDNGLSAKTVELLVDDEFVSMKALQVITADVIDGYTTLSKAQACLLRKAVMVLQRKSLEADPCHDAGTTAAADNYKENLDETLARLERELLTEDGEATPTRSKSLYRELRPHEVLYIRPKRRPDGKELKVHATDISYHEFLAGSLIILDKMMRDESHANDARNFVQYLKFLTKKATGFRAQSVLEFDDEFRSELNSATGEVTSFGDVDRLTEIASHHFDASTALSRNPRQQQKAGQGQGPQHTKMRNGDSRNVCFKWNQNPKSCGGCNYLHQCQVCESADHGLSHHKGKKL